MTTDDYSAAYFKRVIFKVKKNCRKCMNNLLDIYFNIIIQIQNRGQNKVQIILLKGIIPIIFISFNINY